MKQQLQRIDGEEGLLPRHFLQSESSGTVKESVDLARDEPLYDRDISCANTSGLLPQTAICKTSVLLRSTGQEGFEMDSPQLGKTGREIYIAAAGLLQPSFRNEDGT